MALAFQSVDFDRATPSVGIGVYPRYLEGKPHSLEHETGPPGKAGWATAPFLCTGHTLASLAGTASLYLFKHLSCCAPRTGYEPSTALRYLIIPRF